MFTYRKRVFLNPVSSGSTSYILAEVESSQEGEYPLGVYHLVIADCHRKIRLHFELACARDRRRALRKINLLIDVLTRFRDALKREIDLIDEVD